MDPIIKTTKKHSFSCLCCYEESSRISIHKYSVEVEKSTHLIGMRENNDVCRILRNDINSISLKNGRNFILSWIIIIISISLFIVGATTNIWTISYVGIILIIPSLVTCFYFFINGNKDMTDITLVVNKGATILNITLTSTDASVVADSLFPVYSDIVV